MNRTLNFLLWILIGGLVGATAGILLAPASGEELRADISSRADQVRADVSKAAAERRAELEKQLAALRAPQEPEQAPE
jgi:gas vesicle protein